MFKDSEMKQIDPTNTSPKETLEILTGGVGPRPIALVSTISTDGKNNLAPFSFFNAFGSNPPMVAFGPARRTRDGSTKDTYNNLIQTKECVIQAVTYAMVEQVNVASTEYEPGIDEFVKSGLTPINSVKVKPKRVKESPFQMECKLHQMVPLGEKPGSGNLALCEVVLFHVSQTVYKDGIIHPQLLDLVGRNGGHFYTRASGSALFEVEKPLAEKGIGYDRLPEFVKQSSTFTKNDLGRLSNTKRIPTNEEVTIFISSLKSLTGNEEDFLTAKVAKDHTKMLALAYGFKLSGHPKAKLYLEQTAQCALEEKKPDLAWKILLFGQTIK